MTKQDTYRQCTRCVMDITAQDIAFDEQGVCNYCRDFLEQKSHHLFMDEPERTRMREVFVDQVKQNGKGKRYDCIVGVSGGVDSSWALYQAVKYGLRPLAVHMDNGWNSELAQSNIENLVKKLGVDLYTHVIDWEEYRTLMQAFFDADVIDVELLYDNAMLAVNYQLAAKHGIKYILAGTNQSTEGMAMPANWNWFKYDRKNISALAAKFGGGLRLKSFPAIGTLGYIYYKFFRGINWISFLDYFDYQKQQALAVLTEEMDYKPYPYKHYESVFTRFYQGYLLPRKFGVDKRKLHLSTLIASAQIQRTDAQALLDQIPYPVPKDLESDIQYFLKKMGWTREELDNYLLRSEKSHADYGTEKPLCDFAINVYRRLT